MYAFAWTVEVEDGVIASSLRLRFSLKNQSVTRCDLLRRSPSPK
jgi:hypothetical protein